MILPAVLSGIFQFCAGPQTERFYACVEHAPQLSRRESPTSVFWRVVSDRDRVEYSEDQIACDWCRGEDGP